MSCAEHVVLCVTYTLGLNGQRRYKEVEGALQGSKCWTGAERHANRNAHGHADTGNINMEHVWDRQVVP
jgi:hypothetical protein